MDRFLRYALLHILIFIILISAPLQAVATGESQEPVSPDIPVEDTSGTNPSGETAVPLSGESPMPQFAILYAGELIPGGLLEFDTEPHLEGVTFALRLDAGLWTVLENNCYTLPDDLTGIHTLFVSAVLEEPPVSAVLEIPLVPPEPAPPAPEPSVPDGQSPSDTPPDDGDSDNDLSADADTPAADPTAPETETPASSDPGLFFGLLHAHSSLSGGQGTPEELFQLAAGMDGMDFLAVTDHSSTFDNAENSSICADAAALSSAWAAGKAAAAAATGDDFVGIFGYEMSWPSRMQIGHISTFRTPGFQAWEQEAYAQYDTALSHYYDTISSLPDSISQFNHPGAEYGTFSNFLPYSEAADRVIHLLEVTCDGDPAACADPLCGYRCYTRALDAGWHVAPTAGHPGHSFPEDTDAGRTVIRADALTEGHLYSALRSHRVYATRDCDLEIDYTLDGHPMGSRLALRQVGENADISISLHDPTDAAIGLIEVVVNGGKVAAAQTADCADAAVSFSLSPEYSYYYLRITQPDGDVAVTAPVWVAQTEEAGISSLTCQTPVPTQDAPLSLVLELFNKESAELITEQIQILADDEILWEESLSIPIPGGSDHSLPLTCTLSRMGPARITVKVTATLDGCPREYSRTIDLSLRQSAELSDLILDAGHRSTGFDSVEILTALGASENIRVISCETLNPDSLQRCRTLLISAPEVCFSDAFLSAVAEFARAGGQLLICGQSCHEDGTLSSSRELNRLLDAIGSTMRLQSDHAPDHIASKAIDGRLLLSQINRADPLCAGISPGQRYCQKAGCTIDPGDGIWLVKGGSGARSANPDSGGAVLMAKETLPDGGTVLVSGSFFLDDSALAEPSGIWDEPYANRTIACRILELTEEPLPLSKIGDLIPNQEDTLYRIRGYVTVGTANPGNSFPDTLYLQDDTGGVAVIPFRQQDIAPGTPMELTGYVALQEGNRIFVPTTHKILESVPCLWSAKTGSWASVLDMNANGGALVQVEGTCGSLVTRPDGTIHRILLKDSTGAEISILVEDQIRSHATGENTLHKQILPGRTIRATGILWEDTQGDPMIRVRNCEEVVYVPPKKSYNPKTGDGILFPAAALLLSGAGIILLYRKQKRQ